VRRLANEIQRASDTYHAIDIQNHGVSSQLDGTKSTLVLDKFPIVRPHQPRDMKGNTIGPEENPITIVIDASIANGGTVIEPWDGSGKQPAGTYYIIKNANLGHIQFVSEAKELTPVKVNTNYATISYSYASNIAKFDLHFDPAKTTLEKHLNGLLRLVGSEKAKIKSTRFVQPEYLLMSPILNDLVTSATEFIEQNKRKGTDTNFAGDLESIKSIPAFGTDAPGIDLGNERIHMGQRNTTTYVVSKPFQTGKAFEAVNDEGLATGQQMAYGEEYNAIHTPLPVRNRSTGIIVYDSTTRGNVV